MLASFTGPARFSAVFAGRSSRSPPRACEDCAGAREDYALAPGGAQPNVTWRLRFSSADSSRTVEMAKWWRSRLSRDYEDLVMEASMLCQELERLADAVDGLVDDPDERREAVARARRVVATVQSVREASRRRRGKRSPTPGGGA
jgi:hypothetical protein